MDKRHSNLSNDGGLISSQNSCNSNHSSSYARRLTALSQFARVASPPAKPSPPLRTTTSATLDLSSECSLSIRSPSSNLCRDTCHWGGSLRDDDDIDQEEEEHTILKMLMIRSFRYREGCLLLERRLGERAFEMEYLYSREVGRAIGRVLSLATYTSPRNLHQDGFLPIMPLPMIPKNEPPQQSSTKVRLCVAARKKKVLSEPGQKRHPTMPHSIVCSPFGIMPQSPVNSNEQSRREMGFGPQDVQRQVAILQDIQQRNRSSSTSNNPSCVAVAEKPLKIMATTPQSPDRTAAPLGTHPFASPPQVNAGIDQLCSTPLRIDRMTTEDRVTRLSNGKTVWVEGTRHAYKSIITGRATLVQCSVCHTVFQISDTATLLYCIACQEVSPIVTGDSRPSAASTEARIQWDGKIASALQQQEISVGRTIKQAKQAAISMV
jgi:hypothetical protein